MKEWSSLGGVIEESKFQFLTGYLSRKYGLNIPADKKNMLVSRLFNRINKLGLKDINEYITFVFNSEKGKAEYEFFIEYITTHKTFFFRENHQFEYLKELVSLEAQSGRHRMYRIWSAGCSTGEEVYTLGILMEELRKMYPNIDYKLTGTDISVPSLKKAAKGEYSEMELENLDPAYKNRYFAKKIKDNEVKYRFKELSIANRVNFGILNLNKPIYNLPTQFDFIFCRNVIIYFDNNTKTKVIQKLLDKLKTGGTLFLGHSETAIGSNLPIVSIRPTIYQKL